MLYQTEKCEIINKCIACDSPNLQPVLDLNSQPLANSYRDSMEEVLDIFPLAINVCINCFHTQLTHKVNPDLLFKNYLYVSGTTQTQRDYFNWFADYAIEFVGHSDSKCVLDIGCNDGSQLDCFKNKGWHTFGVDPAENLFEKSSINHKVTCDYYGKKFMDIGYFDIITCQNAFAHNQNQFEFMETVKNNMNDNSLLFITTSQVDMIIHNEFDTIYHEHLSFYTINSMNELCKRAELYLIDVIKSPIHGNSYIYVISKNKSRKRPFHIQNLLNFERSLGLYSVKTYEKYAKTCIDNANALSDFINNSEKVHPNIPIVGFGASAKGNTLMNFMRRGPNFIIDENPLKQGKYTPGVDIQIVGMEALNKFSEVEKLIFIPLAWNFFDEISSKVKNVRPKHKDVFVRYFPSLKTE